jgi:ubiquinone/menaquinone biosynthesis C-methylase UbiE
VVEHFSYCAGSLIRIVFDSLFQAIYLGARVEDRKAFFNRHAPHWDDRLQYEKQIPQLLELIKSFDLQEGYWVLDVGTGTGILLSFMEECVGRKGKVVAMDFSLRMLEYAKLRKCRGGKMLVNASVEAIPIRPNQFDRVTCFSAFPHFPNKARALFEMVRVLKSGGKMFIAHLHSAEEINQLHQSRGGAVSRDLLPPPGRIQNLLRDSGLYEISVINQSGRFLATGTKI